MNLLMLQSIFHLKYLKVSTKSQVLEKRLRLIFHLKRTTLKSQIGGALASKTQRSAMTELSSNNNENLKTLHILVLILMATVLLATKTLSSPKYLTKMAMVDLMQLRELLQMKL